MQQVAELWWLWLLILVVSISCQGYNQVQRMKRMWVSGPEGFHKGIGLFVFFGVVTIASLLLLIIAVLWYLVRG